MNVSAVFAREGRVAGCTFLRKARKRPPSETARSAQIRTTLVTMPQASVHVAQLSVQTSPLGCSLVELSHNNTKKGDANNTCSHGNKSDTSNVITILIMEINVAWPCPGA